ncbi:MAG TPA: ATP-binding protein [Candidatus Acidoferrum sp.]|nr:ATP-binding protein [Candidatus Acidoferrum sp.]
MLFGVKVPGGRTNTKHGANSSCGKCAFHAELLLKLHLESNPQALALVRAAIERATEVLHFHEEESRAIVRSVDEALANVIRHAYRGKSGCPIEVTCRHLHRTQNGACVSGIEIVLRDSGVRADPAKMKGRSLKEIRPGGLGLHFMRESMDEVEFSRKKGKNQLRLVKYLAPAAPAAAPEGE